MPLELRPYQRDAIDALYAYWATSGGNGLIVLPTGSGKALVIAKLIEELLEGWPRMRILNVTHSKTLVEQNYKEFVGLSPFAPAGIYSAGLGRKDQRAQVLFGGIQSIATKVPEICGARTVGGSVVYDDPIDLVLVDEAHAISRNADTLYGKFFKALAEANPDSRRAGLTATDYRLDSGRLTDGEDRLFDEVVYEISIRELIEAGFLAPLSSKQGDVTIDLSGVHKRGGEYIPGELERAADLPEVTRGAVQQAIEKGQNRRAWLFFCSGQDHSEHVRDELVARGIPAASLTSRVPDGEQRRILEDFRSGKIRALASANMLTTGFNVPHVDLISMLRPTASTGLYVQTCLDAETEILTRRGWLGVDAVAANDNVAGFDTTSGTSSWQPILGIVDRHLESGERMVGVSAPHLDFRVTDNHDMIVACRSSRFKRSEMPIWKKEVASETMLRKDSILLPVAANMNAAGAPITDHEIAFLGWFLSDGTLSKRNNCLSIAQSVESNQNEHIRSTLAGCDIRFGYQVVERDNDYAAGGRYNISFGDTIKPNGTGVRGWSRLAAWINHDKHITSAYDDLTREQLLVLIDALNRGDGSKRIYATWKQATMSITFGIHKHTADRIQELCVLRGIRCNAFDSPNDNNYILHICPTKDRAVIGGSREANIGRSAIIDRKGEAGERVWCVETPMGTIFTRRNGKVTITGNCGRGTRLAPGKKDCLILDHAGNVARHGPVDTVTPKDPGKGMGEAPVKLCPNLLDTGACNEIVHISVMVCPCCGFEFPPNEEVKITAAPSSAPILSTEQVWQPVTGLSYAYHMGKEDKPPSVRVEYRLDRKRVEKHWVCPEHTGYAKQKSDRYWRHHGGQLPFPSSVDEFLDRVGELRVTAQIQVDYTDRFHKVVGWLVGEAKVEPATGDLADVMRGANDNRPVREQLRRAVGERLVKFDDISDEIPF